MRRYKHKKTGYVGLETKEGNYILPKLSQILPSEIIENSNDWEEIIEKKPLFVTEDGVEVFEDSIYYQVNSNFKFYPIVAEEGIKPTENCVIFSTQKAAQQYIDLHKPKYSLKDVEDALSKYAEVTKKVVTQNLKNLNK